MKIIILFVIPAFLFVSCDDLSSPYPAGKVEASYCDSNLVGIWECAGIENFATSNLSVDSNIMTIMPFNEKEYLIQIYGMGDSFSLKDISLCSGFISDVGNYRVANIKLLSADMSGKQDDYLIYPFYLSHDTLIFYSFYSNKVDRKFTSTKDLRKFLIENMAKRELYSSIRKYKKKNVKML